MSSALRSILRPLVSSQAVLRAAPLAATQQRSFSQTMPRNSALTSKTGQTGVAVLGTGLAAYLVSKEILILHAETVVIASLGIVTYALIKKVGGDVAASLDERAKTIQDNLSAGRVARIQHLETEIAEQESIKNMMPALGEIFNINRELNNASRELAYRSEKHEAREAAIKQLNEIVQIEAAMRAEEQSELVRQLEREVLESIKGQEGAIIEKCIQDLKALGQKQAAAK